MRTHFHRPDPRASANVQNPFGILQRCEEQPIIVYQFKHVMLHIQSVKFLLIVWIDVGCRFSSQSHRFPLARDRSSNAYHPHDTYGIFFHVQRDNPSHQPSTTVCHCTPESAKSEKLTTRLALMQRANRESIANEAWDNKVQAKENWMEIN